MGKFIIIPQDVVIDLNKFLFNYISQNSGQTYESPVFIVNMSNDHKEWYDCQHMALISSWELKYKVWNKQEISLWVEQTAHGVVLCQKQCDNYQLWFELLEDQNKFLKWWGSKERDYTLIIDINNISDFNGIVKEFRFWLSENITDYELDQNTLSSWNKSKIRCWIRNKEEFVHAKLVWG